MRVPCGLLLVLPVLLVLAGMAVGSSPDLGRPSLTPGDSWTYHANSTLSPGLVIDGTVTATVAARETDPVLGVSMDVFRVNMTGSGSASGRVNSPGFSGSVTGAWVLTGQELLETSELKVVSSTLDVLVNGTYAGFIGFTFRVQNTTELRILDDSWQYPLAVNSTGDLQAEGSYTQDVYMSNGHNRTTGSGSWTISFALGSPESVPTAAGTFESYPIRETWPDGTFTETDLSPVVGNAVEIRSYNATGALLATQTLTAYRYQALETPTFLGLSLVEWALAGAVAAGILIAAFVVLRRRRRVRAARLPTADLDGPPKEP